MYILTQRQFILVFCVVFAHMGVLGGWLYLHKLETFTAAEFSMAQREIYTAQKQKIALDAVNEGARSPLAYFGVQTTLELEEKYKQSMADGKFWYDRITSQTPKNSVYAQTLLFISLLLAGIGGVVLLNLSKTAPATDPNAGV